MENFKKHIDYDPDLEKSVLGVFLLEPNSFGSVYGILSPDCFYDLNHKSVYETIEKYWKDGGQVDLLTIVRQFYDNGVTEIKGQAVAYFLTILTMDVVSSAHLQTWCLFLRELYAKRVMYLATHGGFSADNVFETAAKVQEEITKALSVKTTSDWISGQQLETMMSERMSNVAENGNYGISTTFENIDKSNGGFKPGQMVVIAARPGVGKSALMGRIATHSAAKGLNIGIISLEMVSTDVFTRMVSAESDVPFKTIDQNLLFDQSQKSLVYSKIATLARLPIFFSETAQVNIFDIRAKAEQLQRRKGLDLLMIDYLQLIESAGMSKNSNRENEVSKISRGIKLMAMDLKIPVIVLAQLNRNVESRTGNNRFPILSDLRESGSIEQDADVVMFIHSDFKAGVEQDENGISTDNRRHIIVAKWRNGEGSIKREVGFDGSKMKFYEIDPNEMIDSTPVSSQFPVRSEPKQTELQNFFNEGEDAPF